MYNSFLKSELKKTFRDPMMLFMFFSPLLFGAMGRYVIPGLAEANNFNLMLIADYIIAGLTLMIPVLYGALIAFSILDDRDDNVITSVKVSPLGLNKFLSFRVVFGLICSFIGILFIMWFSDIATIALKDMLLISFLSCLATPIVGMAINIMASNKIEGFAGIKGSQIVLLIPLIALYFKDYKELFFAIIPGFWPAKLISIAIRGENFSYLTYNSYLIIGLLYMILINIIIYKKFIKKI